MRVGLHRLNRPDTEWIEKAIAEDVARGRSPPFPTKESPEHKAIKRSRRMVVDYRQVNRVTERRYFLIPDSNGIKSTVAGSQFISVGDLKEGTGPRTSRRWCSSCLGRGCTRSGTCSWTISLSLLEGRRASRQDIVVRTFAGYF